MEDTYADSLYELLYLNLIKDGFHFSFLFCCCFFLNFFHLYRARHPSSYTEIVFTSLSPFYSFFVLYIRTCEKFILVNYIVFSVFFCYAAQSSYLCRLYCFCVYCAGKVRFWPQLWLTFSLTNNSQRQRMSTNFLFPLNM